MTLELSQKLTEKKTVYPYDDPATLPKQEPVKKSIRQSLSADQIHAKTSKKNHATSGKHQRPSSLIIPTPTPTHDDEHTRLRRRENYKNKTISKPTIVLIHEAEKKEQPLLNNHNNNNNNNNTEETKEKSVLDLNKTVETTKKTRRLRRSLPLNTNTYKDLAHFNYVKDAQEKLKNLTKKLDSAEKEHRFSLQLKIGKEVDSLLSSLEDLFHKEDVVANDVLKDEIKQTIREMLELPEYQNYHESLGLLRIRFEDNQVSNQMLIENIENISKRMVNPIEKKDHSLLKIEKEICFEGLLLKINKACEELPGLRCKETNAFPTILNDCRNRLYLLLKDSRLLKVQEERIDYLNRLLNTIVTLKKKSYVTAKLEMTPCQYSMKGSLKISDSSVIRTSVGDVSKSTGIKDEETKINVPNEIETLISDIQLFLGTLENDIIWALEKNYCNSYAELIQVREIIQNGINKQCKYILDPTRLSIQCSPRKRREITARSGSSEESRATIVVIMDKLDKDELVSSTTNKIILEIIKLMQEKSPWIQAILTNRSEECDRLNAIKNKVQNRLVCRTDKSDENHDRFWRLLLDPCIDNTIQKHFMLTYRNTIDMMTLESGYPSEKLFKLFNEKFASLGPYQRKQILLLARDWLTNPVLRLKSTEKEIMEFNQTTLQIDRLVEQVNKSYNPGLISLVRDFKALTNKYIQADFKKPGMSDKLSPVPMLNKLANFERFPKLYMGNVSHFADTLKTLSLHHFLQINSSEWIDGDFSVEKAPHIRELINYSNDLGHLVEETFISLSNTDLKSREKFIEFFIDVMARLTDIDFSTPSSPIDFFSALTIYSVLSKIHIEKYFIKEDVSPLKISTQHRKKYNEMTDLFSNSPKYNALREKHKNSKYYIPAMSILVSDLTIALTTDFNKLFINDCVNVPVIELIGKTAQIISSLQSELVYVPEKAYFNLAEEFSKINLVNPSNPNFFTSKKKYTLT